MGGIGHWVHVACDKLYSLFGIYRGRGKDAHVGMGVLPGFISGIAHRDAYRPYDDYAEKRYSLCCGHEGPVDEQSPGQGIRGLRELEPAQEFMHIHSIVGAAIKQAICPLQTLESVFTQGNSDYMKLIRPD